MNIAILGATGNFGRLFTAKLLSNPDYHITAISKSAENLFEDSFRLTAKSIDAGNQKDLKKALEDDIDIIYCAVSGSDQPVIARNLIEAKPKRVIYMTVVGIYNELEGEGSQFNLENETEQIPNRNAADIIEESDLDYTIIRSGYLIHGEEDDFTIARKGETPKGYVSTFESVEKVALEIIEKPEKYLKESISVTKDMS